LKLADDEMKEIGQLDAKLHDTLVKHASLFCMYYGTTDHWVPLDHCASFKVAYPEATVVVCEKMVPHAFIERHSKVMAEKTAKFILLV
jgi:Lipid-droplet associated hydrolase